MLIFVLAAALGLIPAGIANTKGQNPILWWIYGALLFPVALAHSLLLKSETKAQSGYAGSFQALTSKWDTLVELDSEVRQAADAAAARGTGYEVRLAEKYLALDKKEYLQSALKAALDEADENDRAGYALNGTTYRIRDDGSYLVTSGSQRQKTFANLSELRRALT